MTYFPNNGSELVILDDPIDITARFPSLPGTGTLTFHDIDISDLVPRGAGSALIKYFSRCNDSSMYYSMVRGGRGARGPASAGEFPVGQFWMVKTQVVSGSPLFGCENWVALNELGEFQFAEGDGVASSVTQEAALMGYQLVGSNYPVLRPPVEIFDPPIDVTSKLIGDSTTSLTVVDFTSDLPAGDQAQGVILHVRAQTGSSSEKKLLIRKNGVTETGVLELTRLDARLRGGPWSNYAWVNVDGSNQVEMRWTSTISTTTTQMRLIGRYY